jgi:formate dehydrogenase iron-sulfur subunit
MEKLLLRNIGVADSHTLATYQAHGGYGAWRKVVESMKPEQLIDEVKASGLRGRGGAGFPTGMKWSFVPKDNPKPKYVVCNADESEPGTFKDRLLIEQDPHAIIEGTLIAAYAIQSHTAFIYIRGEMVFGARRLEQAVAEAVEAGYIGKNLFGSGYDIDLIVHRGAGAYICGEETAMLESLEGKRGMVRYKPPLPAIQGLFGKPTVINNVITFASVPIILDKGAAYYRDFGMGRSRGTLPFQLAGNIKHGGLVEKAFGLTLRELLYDYGGGSATGRPIRAVQVGGPLGAFLPESQFDTPLDYEAFAKLGAMIGHGGVVAFDDTVDMARMARYAMEFCSIESCGKCTPCRIGSTRGVEVIERIMSGEQREANITLLRDLCETMVDGSLCAMGGMTPFPVLSALDHFPEDFGSNPANKPAKAAA